MRPAAPIPAATAGAQLASNPSDLFLLERQRRLDAGAIGHAAGVPSPFDATRAPAGGTAPMDPTRTVSIDSARTVSRTVSREMRTSSGVRFADETPEAALSRRLSDACDPLLTAEAPSGVAQTTSNVATQTGVEQRQQEQEEAQEEERRSLVTPQSSDVTTRTVSGGEDHQQQKQRRLSHSGSGGSDLASEGRTSSREDALRNGGAEPVRRPSRRVIVKHLGGNRGVSALDHGGGSDCSRAGPTVERCGSGGDGGHEAREARSRRGSRVEVSPERAPSGSAAFGAGGQEILLR